jgi:hypothetical protein
MNNAAWVRVTDELRGGGREVRVVSFYRDRSEVQPLEPLLGCLPISRKIETRKTLGGGAVTQWEEVAQ